MKYTFKKQISVEVLDVDVPDDLIDEMHEDFENTLKEFKKKWDKVFQDWTEEDYEKYGY